jgi:PIN domain nuclease of toxin-antitoxin system
MTSFLLDTQVAIWILCGSNRLRESEFIKRFPLKSSRFIFHQASTWEIQIKYSLGKLPLPKRPELILKESVKDSGFHYERIDDEAIFMLDKLPKIHNDPFDRLLISHAMLNAWTIISSDEKFEKYPVKLEKVG